MDNFRREISRNPRPAVAVQPAAGSPDAAAPNPRGRRRRGRKPQRDLHAAAEPAGPP